MNTTKAKAAASTNRNDFLNTSILTGERSGLTVFDYSPKAKIYQKLFADKAPVVAERVLEQIKPTHKVVELVKCNGCGASKAFCKMSKKVLCVCKSCVNSLRDKTPSERNRFFAKIQTSIIKNLKGAF